MKTKRKEEEIIKQFGEPGKKYMVMDNKVKRKKSLGKEKIIQRVHDKMYLTCTCIQ